MIHVSPSHHWEQRLQEMNQMRKLSMRQRRVWQLSMYTLQLLHITVHLLVVWTVQNSAHWTLSLSHSVQRILRSNSLRGVCTSHALFGLQSANIVWKQSRKEWLRSICTPPQPLTIAQYRPAISLPSCWMPTKYLIWYRQLANASKHLKIFERKFSRVQLRFLLADDHSQYYIFFARLLRKLLHCRYLYSLQLAYIYLISVTCYMRLPVTIIRDIRHMATLSSQYWSSE